MPSPTRNVSSLSLRRDGCIWLFDCGEGTQHQISRSTSVKASRIQALFITHLHGDHVYGLPGLLCSIGGLGAASSDAAEQAPLHIYGPLGLAMYLRTALTLTQGELQKPYQIHEMCPDPDSQMAPDWHSYYFDGRSKGLLEGLARLSNLPPGRTELPSRQILPEPDGTWKVCEDDNAVVTCAPVRHSIPTVGFAVSERDKPGSVRLNERVERLLQSNAAALLDEQGIRNPKMLLKTLKGGNAVRLPDGECIAPEEVVGPATRGRRVVILGDTFDPSAAAALAQDCDVLVHEATNAKLSSDVNVTGAEVEERAISHGHSTPQMAGQFAKHVKAKMLCLNHFSSRYGGDRSNESDMQVMAEIGELAAVAMSSGPQIMDSSEQHHQFVPNSVLCTTDFATLSVSMGTA